MTDRKRYQYKSCHAVLGTMTGAQTAYRALTAAAIPSNMVKTGSSSRHGGCIWSVSFACNQTENVKAVLASAGINVRSVGGGDDIP